MTLTGSGVTSETIESFPETTDFEREESVAFCHSGPRLTVAHVRQRPESVHLQLEDVVVMVERFGTADQVCWCELRKGQADFQGSGPSGGQVLPPNAGPRERSVRIVETETTSLIVSCESRTP